MQLLTKIKGMARAVASPIAWSLFPERWKQYIEGYSEDIPLEEAECDAVFSFNSLDHVKDVDQTLREIKRVTRPGGIFLLLVDVNHPPTVCEPHQLSPVKLVRALEPEFTCERLDVFRPVARDMYGSVRAACSIPQPEDTGEPGYLSAKFVRC